MYKTQIYLCSKIRWTKNDHYVKWLARCHSYHVNIFLTTKEYFQEQYELKVPLSLMLLLPSPSTRATAKWMIKKKTRVSGATITVNNENAFLYSIDLNELEWAKKGQNHDKLVYKWKMFVKEMAHRCLYLPLIQYTYIYIYIYTYMIQSKKEKTPIRSFEHPNITTSYKSTKMDVMNRSILYLFIFIHILCTLVQGTHSKECHLARLSFIMCLKRIFKCWWRWMVCPWDYELTEKFNDSSLFY